jgi:cytochrome c553
MKTSSILRFIACAAAMAGCAQGQGHGERAEGPGAPQPGAQPSQAGTMQTLQENPPGPAQALGQPGAAASQAGGAPNPQAGEQLAAKGAPNGVTACVSCHGAQGEGNAQAGFPRIAGQSSYYIGKQLAAYANGARVNPVMQPIAKAMNAQQIRDVSAYYAGLAGTQAGGAAPAGGGQQRARQLVAVGDPAKRVQACNNCHGPGGAGEPPSYPYLAGQHASYLTASMGQWKSGARKTDLSGQMTQVARALSDADVAALSAYFSAQPAPPPATKLANIPAGSTEKPAVAAAAGAPGPRAGGAAGVTGAGTEAGGPVMGGSQGPGGGGGTQGTQPPPPPVKR